MSKKEQIIAKLKEVAKIALGTEELKFTDAKTIDGVIIRYEEDELATGVIVSVVDEAGAVLIAPIGSYALEDGTTFDVVDDLGTADNIVTAEENPEVTEENMEETNVPAASAPAVEQTAKSIVETVSKETRFEEEVEAEVETPVEVVAEVTEEVAEPIVAEETFATQKISFEAQIKEVEDKFEAKLKELFTIIESMGTEEEVKTPTTKKDVFKHNDTSKERAKRLKESFDIQIGRK